MAKHHSPTKSKAAYGTNSEVYHGKAVRTRSGLTKRDLYRASDGTIKSRAGTRMVMEGGVAKRKPAQSRMPSFSKGRVSETYRMR